LKRISFHNEENDFVVAKLREKERKELTTIIGTKKALVIAIRNNKPQRRYTLLSERLTAL
jgi:hypothetical protein